VRAVVRLSIAPVKSLRLQHAEQVMLERFGVAENRRFYVSEPGGSLINGVKHGPLQAVLAHYELPMNGGPERLALRFPDGRLVEGHPTAIGRPIQSDFYGRPVTGHVVEGPWSAELSAFAGRRLELVRCDRPGEGSDGYPVSLFSTASAEELARRSGSVRVLDSRRFRMLIEVGGCEPYEEDSWVGRLVRLGGAIIRVAGPVARCVVTTLDPDTGVKDFDTLQAIKAHRGVRESKKLDFGVYARVLEPGSIRVGDSVEPLSI